MPLRLQDSSRGLTRWLPLLLLLVGSVWVTTPFNTRGLLGSGDAVWYHHQIGDAIIQFRQGVFPVLVGQTQGAFNGAVHPIRTAPYCQYLAGLIDLLTGRSLEFSTLLHLTAWLSLLLAALLTYVALVWLAPLHRVRAAVLAWIYVSTPGVLGLVYSQDLYMSTMAAPWTPLAFAALLQIERKPGARLPPVVLGVSIGALWWAHSPIALWSTLAIAAVFGVRLLALLLQGRRDQLRVWIRDGVVVGTLFAVLSAYPIISVFSLRSAGEGVATRAFDRASLVREINGAFPQNLQPLHLDRPLLTFMQPGYAVLGALALAIVLLLFRLLRRQRYAPIISAGEAAGLSAAEVGRTVDSRAVHSSSFAGLLTLVGLAVVYLALMFPVPHLTAWIWFHAPELLVNVTNIWPMQRFSMIVAALTVVSLHAAWPPMLRGALLGKVSVIIALVALIWSGWEAQQLRSLARARTQPESEVAQLRREENINVSEIAYQQLSRRPDYFIHGVTDPRMEVRLLDSADQSILQTNKAATEKAATSEWRALRFNQTANPALFELSPEFVLEPGVRYLLTFEFADPAVKGLLRLVGPTLRRVYVLPSAGERLGFGAGPAQEKSVVVWTSQSNAPERFKVEWICDDAEAAARYAGGAQLGRIRLTPIVAQQLPINVKSVLPVRMHVKAPQASLLETMRVFIPGWSAKVNDTPAAVSRSKQGLVSVAVPAGESDVELRYEGPLLVRVAFWISLGAWILVTAIAVAAGVRLAWRSVRGAAIAG